MKKLIIATLACSSVDSLNPIGITQQFILQGLVKKPKHIWYFILTTGVVNMIFGYLVYYGVMTLINNKLDYLLDDYGIILYSLEIFLGLVILFLGIKHTYKNIKLKQSSNYQEIIDNKEEEIKSKIRSVSPLALIGIGIASTVSELTSAVPYFTFLAVLINYKISFLIVTSILIVYNIIYMLPFMVLYFIYIISKNKFDKIYNFFRKYFRKFSNILIPLLMFIVAFIILYHAIRNLIIFI